MKVGGVVPAVGGVELVGRFLVVGSGIKDVLGWAVVDDWEVGVQSCR